MKVRLPVEPRTRHTRRRCWRHQSIAERPVGRVHESGEEQLHGRGLRHFHRNDAKHAYWQMGARVTRPTQLCVAQTECHAHRTVTILAECATVCNRSKCVRACVRAYRQMLSRQQHPRPMQYPMRCCIFPSQVQVSAHDRAPKISNMRIVAILRLFGQFVSAHIMAQLHLQIVATSTDECTSKQSRINSVS